MNLERQLTSLEVHGLIRRTVGEPELAYLFRHVLTQEAAYASLLKQDRRRLHLAVAETLELDYPQHLDDMAPILARHFDEGEDAVRAQCYFTRAGEAAARRYAHAEASLLYARALELAHRLGVKGDEITPIYLRCGRQHEISGNYVGALATYLDMEMLAEERRDRRMLLAALMARATVLAAPTTLSDPSRAEELARRALELAHALGDRESEAKALWLMCLALRFTEHVLAARDYGERAAALARELNLREQLAYALNDLFPVYMTIAEFAKGRMALRESVTLWRELDNPGLLVDALTSSAELDLFAGRIAQAAAGIDEAVTLADRIDNPWGRSYSRWTLSSLQAERGEFGAAIRTMEESIDLGAQAGFAFSQIAMRGFLAVAYAELGAFETGLTYARAAIQNAETLRPSLKGLGYASLALCQAGLGQYSEAEAALATVGNHSSFVDLSILVEHVATCEVALAQGQFERVLAISSDAQETLSQYGMAVFMPLTSHFAGMALLGLGRPNEADARFAQAEQESRDIGSRRVLWRTLFAHALCATRLGQIAVAETLRARAQAEVVFIAGGLGSSELRATFLGFAARISGKVHP
jgi:hypothetical protein